VHEACFSSTVPTQGATSLCPNGTMTQTGPGSGAACSGMSGCQHGTHVAGIAAGYQSASFAGVARGAQIIAIQVFSRFSGSTCGGGNCVLSYTSDQIRALDYVRTIRGTYNIASVNMSLGGGVHQTQTSCDLANQSTKAAIDALRAAGTATVIASGNDGYINAMSEPGCISSAISVGNTTDTDSIYVPSNIAPFLTMMAPGTSVQSSILGGAYGSLTGTSMSTPHVAGALAVLRQANPGASVADMIAALRNGGRMLSLSLRGSSGTTYNYNMPRLDVAGALNALNGNITPAAGWWWNPSEAGRGFSLETRNGRIFLGTFLYEDDGSPLWFVVNGPQSGSSFSGSLQRFGSGQTLSGAYQAPQLVGTAGTATLNFTSSTSGTLSWPGGTIPIQRFPVNGQSVQTPQAGAPTAGWWWNASESGTGWFFEVQGSNIFLSGYLYDADGGPAWYVSSGSMLSPTAFDGDLQRYGGGQTLTGGYRAPSSSTSVGQVSLRFTSSNNATLTLPQGRTINLTRFTNF
jgi:subtilisin family serine protease